MNLVPFLETIRRWRTWIVNTAGALLILLPELLNTPEIIAVIPVGYQKYVFVAALLLNILMRPRPATLPNDPEVKVAQAIADTPGATTVVVKSTNSGDVTAVVRA